MCKTWQREKYFFDILCPILSISETPFLSLTKLYFYVFKMISNVK